VASRVKKEWRQKVAILDRQIQISERKDYRFSEVPMCSKISPKWKTISTETAQNEPKLRSMAKIVPKTRKLRSTTSQFSGVLSIYNTLTLWSSATCWEINERTRKANASNTVPSKSPTAVRYGIAELSGSEPRRHSKCTSQLAIYNSSTTYTTQDKHLTHSLPADAFPLLYNHKPPRSTVTACPSASL